MSMHYYAQPLERARNRSGSFSQASSTPNYMSESEGSVETLRMRRLT